MAAKCTWKHWLAAMAATGVRLHPDEVVDEFLPNDLNEPEKANRNDGLLALSDSKVEDFLFWTDGDIEIEIGSNEFLFNEVGMFACDACDLEDEDIDIDRLEELSGLIKNMQYFPFNSIASVRLFFECNGFFTYHGYVYRLM